MFCIPKIFLYKWLYIFHNFGVVFLVLGATLLDFLMVIFLRVLPYFSVDNVCFFISLSSFQPLFNQFFLYFWALVSSVFNNCNFGAIVFCFFLPYLNRCKVSSQKHTQMWYKSIYNNNNCHMSFRFKDDFKSLKMFRKYDLSVKWAQNVP